MSNEIPLRTESVTLPIARYAVGSPVRPAMMEFGIDKPTTEGLIKDMLWAKLDAWFIAGCPQTASASVKIPRSWWSYTKNSVASWLPRWLGKRWLQGRVRFTYITKTNTVYGRLCPHISAPQKDHVHFLLYGEDESLKLLA